jgi:nuclear GTP-binding protein
MFKANLQSQGTHLSTFNLFKKSIADSTDMADTLIHSTKAIGTDHLIQLIKQISKVEGSNRAVTVGLIGYPNVGKSSVINSLKRNKACEVSSTPGCTKALQEVKLDSQVKLLDCPGVIFAKELTRNQLILQNTAKYDDGLDEVIDAILERIPKN